MDLFSSSIDKFCKHCLTHSIWQLAVAGALSLMSLSVVVNVLRQLLFKSIHEPPVVFHWFFHSLAALSTMALTRINSSSVAAKRYVVDGVSTWNAITWLLLIVAASVVRRHFHLRTSRQEYHRLPGHEGQ
jgi:hypothetical protein